MSVENQEPEIPEGFDFVIRDPRAVMALNDYAEAVLALGKVHGELMVLGYGLPEAHAAGAMTNRLLTVAASLSCGTAMEYLGRDPDPERWRKACEEIFAQVAPCAKAVFQAHADLEASRETKSE